MYAERSRPPVARGGLVENPGLYDANRLINGLAVEAASTFFVCFAALMSYCQPGSVPPNNWSNEFTLPVVTGLVVLCIKDQEGIFADCSPSVTIMEYVMGAYASLGEVAVRIVGQVLGASLAVALALCPGVDVADLTERVEIVRLPLILFSICASALLSITIANVVYPLLNRDTYTTSGARGGALALAVSQWALWKVFYIDGNVCIFIVHTIVRNYQHKPREDESGTHLVYGLLGYWVGCCVSCVYARWAMPHNPDAIRG